MLQGQQISGSTRSCLVAESSRGRGIRVCIGLWEPGLLGPPRAAMQREELTGSAEVPPRASQTGKKGKETWLVEGTATCGKVTLLVSVGGHCESHLSRTPRPEIIFIFREMKQGLKWYWKFYLSQARRTKHRFHCVTKHKVTLSVLWNSGSFLSHWELLGWL